MDNPAQPLPQRRSAEVDQQTDLPVRELEIRQGLFGVRSCWSTLFTCTDRNKERGVRSAVDVDADSVFTTGPTA